jgi:hypothetical protein
VAHWYDHVYMPIINVIRETNGIFKEFPGKTEGDLYLWVLDHQHYLVTEEGHTLQPPTDAARKFVEVKNKKTPRKKGENKRSEKK